MEGGFHIKIYGWNYSTTDYVKIQYDQKTKQILKIDDHYSIHKYNLTVKQAVKNVFFGCDDETAKIIQSKTRVFASNNSHWQCRPIKVGPNKRVLRKLKKKYKLPPSSFYYNKAQKHLGWRKAMEYSKLANVNNYSL